MHSKVVSTTYTNPLTRSFASFVCKRLAWIYIVIAFACAWSLWRLGHSDRAIGQCVGHRDKATSMSRPLHQLTQRSSHRKQDAYGWIGAAWVPIAIHLAITFKQIVCVSLSPYNYVSE